MKEEIPPCCYVCRHEKDERCELLDKELEDIFAEQSAKDRHMCPPLTCPLRKQNG